MSETANRLVYDAYASGGHVSEKAYARPRFSLHEAAGISLAQFLRLCRHAYICEPEGVLDQHVLTSVFQRSKSSHETTLTFVQFQRALADACDAATLPLASVLAMLSSSPPQSPAQAGDGAACHARLTGGLGSSAPELMSTAARILKAEMSAARSSSSGCGSGGGAAASRPSAGIMAHYSTPRSAVSSPMRPVPHHPHVHTPDRQLRFASAAVTGCMPSPLSTSQPQLQAVAGAHEASSTLAACASAPASPSSQQQHHHQLLKRAQQQGRGSAGGTPEPHAEQAAAPAHAARHSWQDSRVAALEAQLQQLLAAQAAAGAGRAQAPTAPAASADTVAELSAGLSQALAAVADLSSKVERLTVSNTALERQVGVLQAQVLSPPEGGEVMEGEGEAHAQLQQAQQQLQHVLQLQQQQHEHQQQHQQHQQQYQQHQQHAPPLGSCSGVPDASSSSSRSRSPTPGSEGPTNANDDPQLLPLSLTPALSAAQSRGSPATDTTDATSISPPAASASTPSLAPRVGALEAISVQRLHLLQAGFSALEGVLAWQKDVVASLEALEAADLLLIGSQTELGGVAARVCALEEAVAGVGAQLGAGAAAAAADGSSTVVQRLAAVEETVAAVVARMGDAESRVDAHVRAAAEAAAAQLVELYGVRLLPQTSVRFLTAADGDRPEGWGGEVTDSGDGRGAVPFELQTGPGSNQSMAGVGAYRSGHASDEGGGGTSVSIGGNGNGGSHSARCGAGGHPIVGVQLQGGSGSRRLGHAGSGLVRAADRNERMARLENLLAGIRRVKERMQIDDPDAARDGSGGGGSRGGGGRHHGQWGGRNTRSLNGGAGGQLAGEGSSSALNHPFHSRTRPSSFFGTSSAPGNASLDRITESGPRPVSLQAHAQHPAAPRRRSSGNISIASTPRSAGQGRGNGDDAPPSALARSRLSPSNHAGAGTPRRTLAAAMSFARRRAVSGGGASTSASPTASSSPSMRVRTPSVSGVRLRPRTASAAGSEPLGGGDGGGVPGKAARPAAGGGSGGGADTALSRQVVFAPSGMGTQLPAPS